MAVPGEKGGSMPQVINTYYFRRKGTVIQCAFISSCKYMYLFMPCALIVPVKEKNIKGTEMNLMDSA